MKLPDTLSSHFRLTDEHKKALKRLGLESVRDLLYYFPARYSAITDIKLIRDIAAHESVTLFGTVSNLKTKKGWKSKIPMGEATLTDLSGTIKIVWFHQAYLAKMIHEGATVKITGKVSKSKAGELYLTNPEFEKTPNMPIDTHESLFGQDGADNNFGYPIYRETKGVTSKWIYHTIAKIFKSGILDTLEEYIPEEILVKYKLPAIKSALIWIHNPKNDNDATAARKRFAFEEVFFIQLRKQEDRKTFRENKSYSVTVSDKDIKDFMSRFPFTATDAQDKAIATILDDIKKEHPMSRLLEGDVGSGKTAVAATASYAIIKNRPHDKDGKLQDFGTLQVAYMAPTEILATQLFENFTRYFTHTGINIGLITGSGCRKFPSKLDASKLTGGWTSISRTQLLKWVANGEIPILIGTHALIQKSVAFKHLALVIIDEQHRFGTLQRSKLAKKEANGKYSAPHLLSMTATPIPRTLALTIYGDLDLSLLDQMPAGRRPIDTKIIPPDKRDVTYDAVKKELEAGRQLYVICARINPPSPEGSGGASEPDLIQLQLKSVTEEADRLDRDIFPEYVIGMLHSKMSKDEKERVMKAFAEKEIDILVATSVVEVGVNVPNATIIIIEGAERFGLAQLHQLRGRVIRSNHQAYCYLFAESKTTKTMDRLKALVTAKNGFELSELDLALRGAGELGGTKQWGLSDLGMEAIKNIKMVEAARTEATKIIESNTSLSHFPKLKSALGERKLEEMHFE